MNGKKADAKVKVTKNDKVLIQFGGPKQCYAAKNRAEYWAEIYQCWFDTNRTMDHDHNHIQTRDQLIKYDPVGARLCEDVLGKPEWRFVSPRLRVGQAHLKNYSPNSPKVTERCTFKKPLTITTTSIGRTTGSGFTTSTASRGPDSRCVFPAHLFFCFCCLAKRLAKRMSGRIFESRVRPVLSTYCFECHGHKAKGGLKLDSREAALAGGESGPAMVPANQRKACYSRRSGTSTPTCRCRRKRSPQSRRQ